MQSNLDLLRAYAVTLVVVCHVSIFYGHSSFAMLGSVGVALFFVHTCLVLMQSLERQDQTRPLFVPFMIRRLFRIYPLSVFVIIVILVFRIPQHVMVLGHFQGWNYRFTDVASNLMLTQCLWNLSGSIINPMWSLSYEMQMYVLLPVIYLLVKDASFAKTIGIWAVAVGLSMAVCASVAHTTLFTYTPCFMSGVVAYKMQQKKIGNFLNPWFWLAFLALLTFLFIALLRGPISVGQWWIASALIGFAVPFFKQCSWKAALGPANLIARYSYGIYVAHYFCMWAVLEKMHASALIKLPVFVLVLAAVSVTLYHGLEKPFIDLGRHLSSEVKVGRTRELHNHA
jgi:peptidoglycan/LPS O-acetylase OafA/YrhL